MLGFLLHISLRFDVRTPYSSSAVMQNTSDIDIYFNFAAVLRIVRSGQIKLLLRHEKKSMWRLTTVISTTCILCVTPYTSQFKQKFNDTDEPSIFDNYLGNVII